jgi:hypothetical protein
MAVREDERRQADNLISPYRKAQEERILLLKHALEAKMGFDPTNSHYGIEENRAIITESAQLPQPTAQSASPASTADAVIGTTGGGAESADEGMYL